MSAKHIFIDTNILVYAHDADGGEKHRKANEQIKSLWDLPYPPSISTQVIQELYVSLSKKGATNDECRKIVSIYLDWEVIEQSVRLFQAAMILRERFRLSLWDALIVGAAQASKAEILWSEDLQNGQKFDGLIVLNPLL